MVIHALFRESDPPTVDTTAPVIPGDQTFNVPDDTPNSTFLGTLAAWDNVAITFLDITDGNDGAAFHLDDDGTFYVNSQTGMVANGPNFELTATARDAAGNETTEVFYVNVTTTHTTTGPASLAPGGSTLVVEIDDANITDHDWTTDSGPQAVAIHYRNVGATTVTVDLAAGFRAAEGDTLDEVTLQPGGFLIVVAHGGSEPWTTADPYLGSAKVVATGTPPAGAVEIVGFGELAYNSGVDFALPTVLAADVLLVPVSSAGSGDPGAASASIPAGALSSTYSDKPQSGNFQPRQTLLARTLTAADSGVTCTVSPGSLQESIGWVVLRGLTELPVIASKVQKSGGSADGVQFGDGDGEFTAAAGDVLILHGSAESSTPVASNDLSLDIAVTPIITQMNNGRGNWLAIYYSAAGGVITPGQLEQVGGTPYDNWVGTITKAAT